MEIDSFYEPFAGVHILADLYSASGRDSLALELLNEYENRFIKLDAADPDFPLPAADLASHRGWIYLKQDRTIEAGNTFIEARKFFDALYDEDIYSFYKKDFILDLCYLDLQQNKIDEAAGRFKSLEKGFSREFFENSYEEEEYSDGGYYASNVSQKWREKRRAAHKQTVKTLLEMN